MVFLETLNYLILQELELKFSLQFNFFQNGFNISKLKLFVVLKLDEQVKYGWLGFIGRIAESLPKCKQVLFLTSFDDERITNYVDQFMPPHQLIIESEL